jgi:uncharacterized protein (DUF58 family)
MSRLLLGAGLALLLFFAYLTAVRPAFDLAYGFILLFALALAWPRLASRGLSLRRTLNAGQPTVGEPFEESFALRSASRVPAPWVEIQDLSRIPDYQPGRIVALAQGTTRWVAKGKYRRRGWLTFGPTVVKVSEPFGLFSVVRRLDDQNRVLVYPRVRPLPDLVMPEAHHVGNAPRFGSWADYPPDTSGVREYVAGDAFGRIHWPLTARHDRLMSKTFEQPLTADIWIVLDLDAASHHGHGDESTLEYAISLAASMAMQINARGRMVGMIANDARCTVLEPLRAMRQERVILDYLAVAEADAHAPLASAPVWDRLRQLPKRAVAVITANPAPSWMEALRSVRGRNASLLAFFIDPATFGGPEVDAGFDLGSDVNLYVIRKGEDLSRLVRTRDAVRLG